MILRVALDGLVLTMRASETAIRSAARCRNGGGRSSAYHMPGISAHQHIRVSSLSRAERLRSILCGCRRRQVCVVREPEGRGQNQRCVNKTARFESARFVMKFITAWSAAPPRGARALAGMI